MSLLTDAMCILVPYKQSAALAYAKGGPFIPKTKIEGRIINYQLICLTRWSLMGEGLRTHKNFDIIIS